MITAFVVALALLLDRAFGEPRRLHPLVGFGTLASWIESRIYETPRLPLVSKRMRGIVAIILLLAPFVALSVVLSAVAVLGPIMDVILLYLALGMRSLTEHAVPVREALHKGDLLEARERVARIVSRDTSAMRHEDVARAAVESVLENGNDAVFGALLWFVIAGSPGVVAYRLANTLDAMWGYRTPRYREFGWAAARLDDVMNFIPARLTAVTYALLGSTLNALHCWRTQAGAWESPNAGPVMAAGAGALGLRLGGPAMYHGLTKHRPPLGEGAPAGVADIDRALGIVRRGVALWLAITALIAGGWRLA